MTASVAPPGAPGSAPPPAPPAASRGRGRTVTIAGPAGPPVALERPSPVGRVRRWSAELLTTTPGRLRLESLVVIALAVAAGLLIALVVSDRLASSRRIAAEAAPAIVHARQIQTSLAEANAAAATALVSGGTEEPTQRGAYERALAAAGAELQLASELTGGDATTRAALEVITQQLPVYAGYIETARANYRQGFPVTSAYLNAATGVLEGQIYPATDQAANQAALHYREAYDHQRSLGLILGVMAVALVLVLVALLGYLLLELNRRFRRTLNLPVGAGLVAAALVTAWLGFGFASYASHLQRARVDGYQGTRLYLDVRGLGFAARADEARFLIARGAGAPFETSFQARAGLIEQARSPLQAQANGSLDALGQVGTTYQSWAAYLAAHKVAVDDDNAGNRSDAVTATLTDATTKFKAFSDATQAGLNARQTVFADQMDQADGALLGLRYGGLVVVLLIAGLAAYGLQLRINEYR